MQKTKKTAAVILCGMMILITTIFILLYSGIIWFNHPSKTEFPVRGIDVSAYQGDIDWPVLSKQGIHFAYIKATEGSSFVDEKFKTNFDNAQKADLLIGAYHFFSYDSSGLTQAENFISVVPRIEKMLPPVVDIEFYGDKEKNPLSKVDTQAILTVLLNKLENHYGIRPMIYATQKSYEMYIKDSYQDYPIWIRNVLMKPDLGDQREWTIWQYSNRGKLQGYEGEEAFIDMNVFQGSLEDLNDLGQ